MTNVTRETTENPKQERKKKMELYIDTDFKIKWE